MIQERSRSTMSIGWRCTRSSKIADRTISPKEREKQMPRKHKKNAFERPTDYSDRYKASKRSSGSFASADMIPE
eukprot:9484169-Pyramimonas_sp.AAC.1